MVDAQVGGAGGEVDAKGKAKRHRDELGKVNLMDCEECREEVLRRLDRIEVWAFGPTEQNGARGFIEELRRKVEVLQRSVWLAAGAVVVLSRVAEFLWR